MLTIRFNIKKHISDIKINFKMGKYSKKYMLHFVKLQAYTIV